MDYIVQLLYPYSTRYSPDTVQQKLERLLNLIQQQTYKSTALCVCEIGVNELHSLKKKQEIDDQSSNLSTRKWIEKMHSLKKMILNLLENFPLKKWPKKI